MRVKSILLILICVFCLRLPEAGAIVVFDDGLVHNIDSSLNDIVEVYDSSIGNPTIVNVLTGGVIKWQLKAYENSYINIWDGTLENDLWFYDQSQINIYGGEIKTHISAYGSSQVSITGGEFGENYNGDSILSRDESQITLSGGVLGLDTTFDTWENGKIIIQGLNFSLDYGIYKHSDFPSGGHLTGIFANGDPIDNDFSIENNATIVLSVPEPATLLLLGLGAVMLRRKR